MRDTYKIGTEVQITARIESVTNNGYNVLIPGSGGGSRFTVGSWAISGTTLSIDDLVTFQRYLFNRGWLVTDYAQFEELRDKQWTDEERTTAEEAMHDVALSFFEERERQARQSKEQQG